MPVFAYRGRNSRGELVTGTVDAVDQGAVADQLMSTGVTPVDIRASTSRSTEERGSGALRRLLAPRVGLVDTALFSRQMYTLLKAGVPIMRALGGLQESAINPTLREVIADLRTSLDAGRELSSAMQRHPRVFSQFYVSVVRVGEATGQLEQAFNRLFGYLEFEREVRERIKGALRYPIIVVVVIAAAIAIVNFAVIPAFARIFESHKVALPLLTRVLIGTSNFFLAYWPLMIIAAVLAVLGFTSFVRTKPGRYAWDRAKLRIPIAGPIILKATLARFSRAFSLASAAGVPIVQAMSVVAAVVDNAYLARRIEAMREGVERGESVLRTAVAAGVFTPVVLQMIAVGEETGELDDLLGEVAEMYEREVDHEIKNLAAAIEPIITIALGVLVLMLALGIFLPMWDMARVMLQRK
ncbi:MAG TPA: type II secretion system F family protein [Burkholderiales bacterium]|nr:type II secretion system F family protein [Burkholderiales bacterium]